MEKSIHSARYAVFLKMLKKARQDAGLTQTDLARKIGETQTFVSKIERGERRLDVIEFFDLVGAIGRDPYKLLRKLFRPTKAG